MLESGEVAVDVKDTGEGIADEIRARIFDPFFTTKAVGVGTGLGLSICHGIVTSLGGRIEVQSQRGKGTVFRVVLPAGAGPSSASIAAFAPTDEPGGTPAGHVLVVDDDASLADALAMALDGYRVSLAYAGREAIGLCQTGDYDCVLCDLMMPEVDGIELYDTLARTRPGFESRIVFMTGGAFTQRAREFLDRVPNRRVIKPLEAAELRRAIARQLRATRSSESASR